MALTRGILRPGTGFQHYELDCMEPPADLRFLLKSLWCVRWDLPAGATYAQELLSFPNVTIAFQNGALSVHGPSRARFVATLRGRGWVAGAHFHPASFYAISSRPMREIAERVRPVADATGRAAPPFPATPDAAWDALMRYLRACWAARRNEPAANAIDLAELERVNDWVRRAKANRDIATAADFAHAAAVSVRSLHRMLERYVGVSSKWIVRRARIQQCAHLVAAGEPVAWTRVAQDLGYHDQAHLIRDFKDQIGFSPRAYAEQCEGQPQTQSRLRRRVRGVATSDHVSGPTAGGVA